VLCRTRVCPLYPPTPPTPPYTVYTARSHIASTHTARALRTLRRVPRLWPHGSAPPPSDASSLVITPHSAPGCARSTWLTKSDFSRQPSAERPRAVSSALGGGEGEGEGEG
jgi:hypothetical protein